MTPLSLVICAGYGVELAHTPPPLVVEVEDRSTCTKCGKAIRVVGSFWVKDEYVILEEVEL